jgi:hypothetical protein
MRFQELLREQEHKITTAYHITTVENAEEILYGGLTPSDGKIYLVADTGDKAKLKDELSTVSQWMHAKTERTQEPLTMLKINVAGLPLKYDSGWYTSLVPIAPERITDLGQDELNGY